MFPSCVILKMTSGISQKSQFFPVLVADFVVHAKSFGVKNCCEVQLMIGSVVSLPFASVTARQLEFWEQTVGFAGVC